MSVDPSQFLNLDQYESKPVVYAKRYQPSGRCKLCGKSAGKHLKRHLQRVHPSHYYQNTRLSFGKHKGRLLVDIVRENMNYVNWCLKNIHHRKLLTQVMAMANIKNELKSLKH